MNQSDKGSKSYIPPKNFFRKKINSNFATVFEKYVHLKMCMK